MQKEISTFEHNSCIMPKRSLDRKSVTFHEVHIREYNLIVSDHPCCSADGPPIGIGWDYLQQTPLTIALFERNRLGKRRISLKDLMIPGKRRTAILKDWNIPLGEIRDAEEECDRIQIERYETKKLVTKERRIQSKRKAIRQKLCEVFTKSSTNLLSGQ